MRFSRMRSGRARASLAIAALTTVMAVGAGSAQASQWYVNSSVLPNGVVQPFKCEGGPITVGLKIQKTSLSLTAQHLSCVYGEIRNSGGEGSGNMKLLFSGITVAGAKAGCTAENFESNAAVFRTKTFASLPTKTGVEMTPVSGPSWGNIKFLATCGGLSGNYPIEGSLVAETNASGVPSASQPWRFDAASNAVSNLRWGAEPATISGQLGIALLNGQEFKSE
jgi:hypothetical protein